MVARERADRLTIRASKSGTVLETGARAGEWTPAGQRIARIADLSTLTISAPVAAGIAQQVKPGRKVLVRLPIGTSFETKAKVSEVTLVPGADQAYVVRVVIPNPDPKAVVVGLEAEIELDHGSAE
jgi:multidrug efflux pump subunit AcrA (membrane-fusion protein)